VDDDRVAAAKEKAGSWTDWLYEKGVPIILAILSLIAAVVFLAAIAVILGILPGR
jgi:hypothetical protein